MAKYEACRLIGKQDEKTKKAWVEARVLTSSGEQVIATEPHPYKSRKTGLRALFDIDPEGPMVENEAEENAACIRLAGRLMADGWEVETATAGGVPNMLKRSL